MKTWGKEPESLESIVSLFAEVLGEYSEDKIFWAMNQHAKRSNEFPTPADIVNLIDPAPEKLSREVYIRLSQKAQKTPENMDSDEWKYLREYERAALEGSDYRDSASDAARAEENERLRRKVDELEQQLSQAYSWLRDAERKANPLHRGANSDYCGGNSDYSAVRTYPATTHAKDTYPQAVEEII